jgi:hypothetical protein
MDTTIKYTPSEQVVALAKEKLAAREYQKKRHEDWNDNYELNRNIVKTNRLTQRQAVNIPLMKETLKTILSKIDDPPTVDWKELSGDEQKELFMTERWNFDYDNSNLEGVDIQDKKTVLLYGRSFKKLNYINGEFDCRVLDIYDVVIDPLTDPLDIETARFLIHQNIFRSVREIIADERYDTKAKEEMAKYLQSSQAIMQSGLNKEANDKKNDRLKATGTSESQLQLFAASDLVVNISEHYRKEYDTAKKEWCWYVYIYADDSVMLMSEKLEDLLGVNFLPFVCWGDDLETQDFWSDGIADLVRTPNKVINVWFSQMVENRTLKNFNMHWYDATVQGYVPQTYEPGAGRMLPAPGDPNKTIMPVNTSGLEDTMTMIEFIIKLVEAGSAATATEKGESQPGQQTLGEIQIMVGKAMERTMSMAKFYRRAWKEFCMKWERIVDANDTKDRTFYKNTQDGKMWQKQIQPSDWKSEAGYKAIITSSSEQEANDTKSIQKWIFIKNQFPNNPAIIRISQKRMLGIVDLTPEELKEVDEAEKQQPEIAPLAQPNPEQQNLQAQIQQNLKVLNPV